jgi:2-iminobutanoate/2-iminopropanoate deaminase
MKWIFLLCVISLVLAQQYPLSPVRVFGNMVYTSGQIGTRNGTLLPTFEAQTTQTLINLGNVLKSVGSDYHKVLKTTVYLSDMQYVLKMNDIYRQFFKEPFPARSAFAVKELPFKCFIEIECIAHK